MIDGGGRVRGGGYTPGWTPAATAFMARRTAATHGWAVLPLLRPGMDLLDAGCGPGTITAGLATAVAPGRVVAVDREPGQAEAARRLLRAEGRPADVLAADAADLPLPDGAVGVAFSHALLQHLPDPVAALAEMARVVRLGARGGGRSRLGRVQPSLRRSRLPRGRSGKWSNQMENGGPVRAGRLGVLAQAWVAAVGRVPRVATS